jgi:hypothetical protein
MDTPGRSSPLIQLPVTGCADPARAWRSRSYRAALSAEINLIDSCESASRLLNAALR